MNRKSIALTTAALALGAGVSLALAQPGPQPAPAADSQQEMLALLGDEAAPAAHVPHGDAQLAEVPPPPPGDEADDAYGPPPGGPGPGRGGAPGAGPRLGGRGWVGGGAGPQGAWGGRFGRGPLGAGGEHRPLLDGRRLAAYLQLDETQRTKAREILAAQRDTMRPLMEQQRSLREHLAQLLDDPQADDATVTGVVQQIRSGRRAIESARHGLDAKLSAILSPAQREKLARLRTVMEDLRRAGRGGHEGRGRR